MLGFRQFVTRILDLQTHPDARRCLDWLTEGRELVATHPEFVAAMVRQIEAMRSSGVAGTTDLTSLAHLIQLDRDGIHVFRPTVEQVDAAAHTDPTLPAAAFRLAFPTTVIQVPDGWGVEFGDERPLVISTSRFDDHVEIICHFPVGMQVSRFGLSNSERISDIIDGFAGYRHSDADLDRLYGPAGDRPPVECRLPNPEVVRVVQRIAVTCNLWLSTVGTTTRHLNPAQAARLKAKKRDNRHGYAARQALRRLPQEVRLVQEVNVRPLAVPTPEPGDPTGRKHRPHVRRGHWKMQACGVRWTDHRLTWIEPYVTGGLAPAFISQVVTLHTGRPDGVDSDRPVPSASCPPSECNF